MQQGDLHGFAVLALCVRAGYSPDEAKLIAWASWMTDESSLTQVKWPWQLWINNPGPYFHFVVGDSGVVEANSPQVFMLVKRAETLIQLGIALHTFQDSYSHAGFVGRLSKRNVMGLGRGYWIFPPYGHTQMLRQPDRCEVVWTDTRIKGRGKVKENVDIFRACLREVYELIKKPDSPEPDGEIYWVTTIPSYDKRKAEWAKKAGMPDIRFSAIQAEYWAKHSKEFKAAAKRQRKFLGATK